MKEMLQEYGRIIVSAIIIFIMLGLAVFFKGDYFINALSKLGVNTISYTLNGGTLPDDAVISYREYDEVVLPIPTNTKGTFEGWYETPDFTGEPVIKIEKGSTGDKVYYAKWNSESYAAVYGGTQLIFGTGNVPETYDGKELTTSWKGIDSSTSVPWSSYASAITDVKVIDEIQPVSTARWFCDFTNCSSMDLTKLDTSKTTTIAGMFINAGYNTSTFKLLGLDDWDVSNVTSMGNVFDNAGRNATTWSIGDLSNWNVSSVTNMSEMFLCAGYNATNWSIGDLSNWDVSHVTSMNGMFGQAGLNSSVLTLTGLDKWDVSSVTDMTYMFSSLGRKVTTLKLDLSGWNTSKVTTMYGMFSWTGVYSTTFKLDLSGWDTSFVKDMTYMFNHAGLDSTDWSVIGLDNWNVSSVTNMYGMFYFAGNKATTFNLDLSRWNTSNVTNMMQMFNCAGQYSSNWSVGDISGWDTSKVTNMKYMFAYAGPGASYSLDLSGWDVGKISSYYNREYFHLAVENKITAPVWVK